MPKFMIPVVMGLLFLGACTSPGEKHLIGEQNTATATATPGGEAEEREPLRPPMQQSETGAESQVRYALEVIEFAKKTGNAEVLKELSREGCVPCADAHDLISADRANDVISENIVAGATAIEGATAQVETRATAGSKTRDRVWSLEWNKTAWEFGAVQNVKRVS